MSKVYLIVLVGAVLSGLAEYSSAAVPSISYVSEDIVASIGDDVELKCTVENVGRMSVSWAKRTSETGSGSVVLSMRGILGLSDPRYSITEMKERDRDSATYVFKISKIESADMGSYECQVIISAANKVSKKLSILIKHPPIISEDRTPRTTLVTEGQNLEVTCHATSFPPATFSWSRENNEIMPAGGHIHSGPILRIKNVHRLDRGGYYCIADNGVGQPDKRLIRVEVEFRSQIAVQRPKVAQVFGHAAELECIVQGYPAPSIVWFHNGSELQSNSHYEISNTASSHETTTSVLRIDSVSEEDFGDYFCNASNKLGFTDARLHLFQSVIPVPSQH